MTSLVEVSSHLPSTVGVSDLAGELRLTNAQVRRFTRLYGLDRICRAPERSETDLLLAAFGGLSGRDSDRDRITHVIRVRGVRTAAPYPIDPLRQVRDVLGLRRARTLTVADHGCAGGLLALDVAAALLDDAGDPDALALVLTGEKAFTPFASMLPNVTITGEGVAAVLLGEGPRDRVLSHASRVHGRADGTIALTGAVAAQSYRIYQDALGEVVHRALSDAGLGLSDVDIVLPHNANQVSWTVTADRLGIPKNKIFLHNVGRTGHCFAADPFINHRSAGVLGLLHPGDHVLMVAAGLGQTLAATVLRH
ncbi:3-oxoacyl-[acyl-carrier-protein] synthase III C-terminal domain-containing protein [Pseudonocardia alni]|uniref:3-oxoacyl-[acyl-carrier-protein] synthase III C-terminal domain-containing protein n=1 Tax=Pseudonocardia alni TaxID=33907 RepID=UPI0033D63E20